MEQSPEATPRGGPSWLSSAQIESIVARLGANKMVRRTLPGWGRLHVDRQVPFLCVYRRPDSRPDPWADRLITGEASYLRAGGNAAMDGRLSTMLEAVARTLREAFGGFLIVEIWTRPEVEEESQGLSLPRPEFKIVTAQRLRATATVRALRNALKKIRLHEQAASVATVTKSVIAPPDLPPILGAKRAKELGVDVIGLETRPIFRRGEVLLPRDLADLHRGISLALKQVFFRFAKEHTTHRPRHYHSLGRRAMVNAVWEVDRRLAEIVNAFEFILLVTPVNSQTAWKEFKSGGFRRAPEFKYRPIPVDTPSLKRALFDIPIDKVEDPALAEMFEEKRRELDCKLTMLHDRGTEKFLYGGLQLYGGVDESILDLAKELLARLPGGRERGKNQERLAPAEFAELARAEIEHYRGEYAGLTAKVRIRRDVPGLMVSRGHLLVGANARIPAARVDALLQHEVGTHLLAHYNARAQPFRLLRCGLPGYEELQEGLAVLAEFLAGGLDRSRLRILAARVLGARRLARGASFLEVFDKLNQGHGFGRRTAFSIAMRLSRGGGLVKDAVYLAGLQRLLNYLRGGGELEPLFAGKFAASHVALIHELQCRKILNAPPLRPRVLDRPRAADRLQRIREGLTMLDMIDLTEENTSPCESEL